ncbi:argonaute PAZ domain-containing protein [Pseudoalteromonas luteoviolacea]|uniref:Piwi domain-containing protein n=1 Tax=Pseudoalteromonas luteoviolacea TaxID=43657 RepID=UPI001F412919|nr:Piwi domain-containing protein [Pseudoalteromonas luteoviolacea]MCF6439858.1 argonaute PAZ domain-containing protein [Pseudoalteromonas luteoviolacea]
MQDQLGISAMQLNKSFSQIKVYCYQVAFKQQMISSETAQKMRKLANELKWQNSAQAVTDFAGFKLISLAPLTKLNSPEAEITEIDPITLNANNDHERETIQRIINQGIYSGAQRYARAHGLMCKKAAAATTQLLEQMPSDRIAINSTFLEVFKTVTLTPQLLSSGTCLLQFELKHSLAAKRHVNLQWVLKQRKAWLGSLRRVRNRYKSHNDMTMSFDFVGLEPALNAHSVQEGMAMSLLDYHLSQGNLTPSELGAAKQSAVVKVRTANGQLLFHLAYLLEPVFDFDSLSALEPVLLNRIATKLKWQVNERIHQAHALCGGIEFSELGCGLIQLSDPHINFNQLVMSWRLNFASGSSINEKDVIKYKAVKPITRKRIVPVIVGEHNDTGQNRQRMTDSINAMRALCTKSNKKVTKFVVIDNELELAGRLANKEVTDAIFLIGLCDKANKAKLRDEAFIKGAATQFMKLDHKPKTYQTTYYRNVAAGLFSKAGGQLAALTNLPGKVDLFIGLDMGGTHLRFPSVSFLFSATGAQLGWQIADSQQGEKLKGSGLTELLYKCIRNYAQTHNGNKPQHIVLHRDGKFYEDLHQIKAFEHEHDLKITVVEILKSGAPVLFRRSLNTLGKKEFSNPHVGDYALLEENEAILATYSAQELKKMGEQVTVRPLRIRKVYGDAKFVDVLEQITALSRIHGASLYRHPRLPVTTHHADRFATLRQDVCVDALSRMDRLCPVYL